LLEAIVGGALPSGTELSEVALAAQLNVSRTPVHEALGRLCNDGFVEQRKNRTARVAHSTSQDLQEMYEVRKLLECAAAERAATRLPPKQLAALRQEAEGLTVVPRGEDWLARAIDFDFRFHEAIARASGNDHLRAEIGRYFLLLRAFRRMLSQDEAVGEHLAILRALEARDAGAASRAMAAHLESTCRRALAVHGDDGAGNVA
jgi:DNA-binding GntR family transcriptional regulator